MDHDIEALNPFDEHNQRLEANVRPPQWKNRTSSEPYHLVVIGAGTAGLVTAAGAAGLGARVALVERELMGGDCLNVGCVPSKGLIRSARLAATVRDIRNGRVPSSAAEVSFADAMNRMRRLRARISPADSAKRFAELGVDVCFGKGRFVNGQTIAVTCDDGSENTLEFKKAVIATGARAAAPSISGLDSVAYLTNENLFSLTKLPPRLGVVGSGPIGCEMAQTFARLGSEVYLFERADRILPRADEDAALIVQRALERDGVNLYLNCQDLSVAPSNGNRIAVSVGREGEEARIVVDQLLIAVGRAPNIEGLELNLVDVKHESQGIQVNDHLQTTNPRIYAAGDVCSKYQFTHAADFMARIVIQNSLFSIGPLGKRKVRDLVIPWATYTSPEVAHVGISEREANQRGMAIDTYRQELADVDRAILDGQDEGFVKVHTKQGTDQIVGATIVAENAGDLISEITLALVNKIGLAKVGASIHPYPTQAEAIRKLGDQFNRTKLTPLSLKLLSWLRWLNVGT